MASKKLGKDTKEWQFMADFWKLIQEYFIPETDDKYWDNLIASIDELAEKYENNNLIVCLMIGYVKYLEEEVKHK